MWCCDRRSGLQMGFWAEKAFRDAKERVEREKDID